jgi:F-type H+-transporting ATPase subunit alpha
MAELTINADEITAALKRYVDDYTPEVGTEQVGRIVEVGDGIARVTGLPGAAVNEILEFADGTEGLALNLDEETIGAVILGEDTGLEEEQLVKATGRIRSAGWSTPWASRSTARGPSTPPRPAGSRSRPRASSAASR